MIRVSTTLKKLREGVEDVAPDGYNTEQQLDAMRAARAADAAGPGRRSGTSCGSCSAAEQITLLERDEWTPEIREYLTGYFSREICPVLTPLAFDPGHPFPFISNLSKNFAVVVRHGGRTKFARVKVPDVLPRFMPIPEALSRAGRSDVRVPRGRHPRQHPRALPRHAGQGRAPVPRSSATPTSRSSRTRPTICSRRVDRSLKQLRHGAHRAAAGRSRHADARPQHPRRELRGHRRRGRAGRPIGWASATGCS